MSSEIRQILKKFEDVKILVVGDVMLDRFWWGSVNRISPEAPVPVVNLEKESLIAGGAANVAANIRGLGANPILFGLIGGDRDGHLLKQTLENKGISSEYLIPIQNRVTTTKTRVIANHQQVARIDNECSTNLEVEEDEAVIKQIIDCLETVDLLIISDYNKGFLSDILLKRLITISKLAEKKVLIDPKGKDYKKYSGASLLTPNKKESFEATQTEDINLAGRQLLKDLGLDAILITQGEDGMTIFEEDKEPVRLQSLARHVYDVTGAGDTVISTLGVALAANSDLKNAAKIANVAAGLVVEEVGTTTISFNKLKEHLV